MLEYQVGFRSSRRGAAIRPVRNNGPSDVGTVAPSALAALRFDDELELGRLLPQHFG
jgi:hypothetical protein